MYIYNVTINVEESIHEAWLSWMKNKHIQEVLNTQKFQSARLVKVLVEEDMGGTTYSVQYFTDSKEKLDAYYLEDAPRLREEGMRLFGDKMLAFRTELEVLEEF
jgi:phosphoribosylamine-glycine ligase